MNRGARIRFRALAPLCAISVFLLPASASAAIFTVDTNADGAPNAADCTTPVAGSCSLRDAVAAANAATTGDTINVNAGLFINLSNAGAGEDANLTGDLDIQTAVNTGSLEVVGLGAGAGISAPSLDRVFDNRGVNSSSVTISNIGFSNGNPQTATDNGGTFRWVNLAGDLTLDRVFVQTSRSAIAGGGVLYVNSTTSGVTTTITDSTFTSSGASNFGGAIWTNRALTMRDSILNGIGQTNGVAGFGVIRLDGAGTSSTIDRSSLVGGRALSGGAISVANGASVTVTNSSIGENQAGFFDGGAIHVDGATTSTTFNNVTFNNNISTDANRGASFALTGGATAANQTVKNSIIATNDPDSPNCSVNGAAAPAFISGGYNIQFRNAAGDTPCATAAGPQDVTADPLLPATFETEPTSGQAFYTPAAGSPAINAGVGCAGTTDQLGAARTQGTACDIGAIEQVGPPAPDPDPDPQPAAATASLGKPKSKRNGTVKLPVTTTGAGALEADDAGGKDRIKEASATVNGAGTVTLKLRPTKSSKERLADGRKVKANVEVVFTRANAAPQTLSTKVKLKPKK